MLAGVVNLRDLGARAHLYGEDFDDLGFCHLPQPVAIGDLAAPEGTIFRVVDVCYLPPGGAVELIAVVEPVWLAVAAR